MEVDDIQNRTQTQTPQQPCKYSRVSSNGRIDSSKIALGGAGGGGGGTNGGAHDSEVVGPTTTALATTTPATRAMTVGGGGVGGGLLGGEMVVGSNGTANSRFGRQWQHSSRIIRVSRASGGKDRHSKVWTAKGPRDRRVRLSVTTAIQFYDLQDRLGFDQPSKAVEWLIKAASEAINELPSLNTAAFPPETPRQLSDERKPGGGVNNGVVDDSGDMELLNGEVNLGQNHQQQMGSKSGCSSNNSETSKGSGLSLSRSEIRVKARERARERTAKEKERDGEPSSSMVNVVASHQHNNQQQQHQHQPNVSSMAQTSSFTQLLTAGMTNLNENNSGGGGSSSPSAEMGLFHKQPRASGCGSNNNNNNTANNNQWLSSATSTTQMADYFSNGLMGLPSSSRAGHIGLGSNTSLPQVMTIASFGGGSDNHHQSHHDQLQHHQHQHHHSQQPHFPFMSDQHLIQAANVASGANGGGGGGGGGGGNEYNLNFSMSSTSTTSSALVAAGYSNRGTLQSNSPSLLPYLQRFSAATDGSSLPFFLGSAAVSSASPNVENHHHHQQHQQHFQPPGLQLCYGDGGRQTDQKGKGKN